MCGILGFLPREGHVLQRERVLAQLHEGLSRLAHRGPDHEGVWISADGRAVFGHRRLAIIDLASGNQPMEDWEKRFCVVLNGEIYNFVELRDELESRGHRFSTKSDTEVLLESYKEWGEQCLDRLNGMYAFAIWDVNRNRLFAARDPMGEKPLYYACTETGLVFASEPKALFSFGVRRTIDTASLFDYFAFRSVPSPHTLFDGVNRLGPGQYLVSTDGSTTVVKEYWSWPDTLETIPTQDPEDKFLDLLTSSVKIRLRSDVPVGAFLSGGVDSSLVTALMSKSYAGSSRIQTFSVGVEDPALDEGKYQRAIASLYGTEHITKIVTESEMLGLYSSWTTLADDLVADPSAVALYGLSLLVRDHGIKVVLSGEGADELFGGYGAYVAFARKKRRRQLINLLSWTPNVLKKVGNWCGAGVGRIIEDDLVFAGTASAFSRSNIRQLVPGAVRDTLGDYWGRRKMTNSVGEAMLFDLRQRLPDDIFMRTDRATMAASIESRVPFVDPRLIRWSLSIDDALKVDGTESKVLVKRAASRYLPHGLIYRPKIGFDLPIDRWLRGVFRNEIYEFVSDRKIPGLRYGGVMDLVIGWERSSSPSVKASQVWFWFALERWYRTWIG